MAPPPEKLTQEQPGWPAARTAGLAVQAFGAGPSPRDGQVTETPSARKMASAISVALDLLESNVKSTGMPGRRDR